MSYRSVAPLKAQVCRVLAIVALPLACAVGVDPDTTPGDDTGSDGGTGGSPSAGSPSSSGTTGVVPKAGNSSTGGSNGAFGGTSSNGGAATAGAAGTTSTAGKASGGGSGSGAGGSAGSSAGSGGSAAGAAGSGTGGTGNPPSCDCTQKTLEWKDMTNMSFVTGDCLTADGKTFLYTGAMAQTWAHPDCHPGKQMAWCPGSGYVFMACD